MNRLFRGCRQLWLLAICSAMFPALLFAHADPAVVSSELSVQIEIDTANAMLVLQRAEAYRASRNWSAALADYHTAEHLGMGTEIAFYRARMYLDAGNWSASVRESQNFLSEYPDNALALVVLAYAEYGAGELQLAIASMEQALSEHPAPTADEFVDLSRWYLEKAQPDRALQSLDRGVARLGSPVSLTIRRIDLLQIMGAYPQALLAIDELPIALREQPEWLLRRGDILLLDGAQEQAEGVFRQAQQAIAALPEFRRNNPVNRNLQLELAARLAEETGS